MSTDSDQQKAREDVERSPKCREQGASTKKADSISCTVTEADFIAAKEVALFCLSAIDELHLASGDISTLTHRPAPFENAVLKLRQADETFSRTTCAVEYLCNVLDYAGVQVRSNPIERDRIDWNGNDLERLGKIGKIQRSLLLVSNGRTWGACNSAHEYALRSAIEMWSEIENVISLEQWHEEGSYERGSGFHLKLREIAENGKEIRELIRHGQSLNCQEVRADIEREWVKALDKWKADNSKRPERTQDNINAANDPPPDGPVAPNAFRWQGETFSGLQPVPWRLVNALWCGPNRTCHIDDLIEAVWENHGKVNEGTSLRSAQSKANRFFQKHKVSLRTKKRDRYVSLVIEAA